MKNLKNKLIIGASIISATLSIGCEVIQNPKYDKSILKDYCGKKTEKVVQGSTYWDFSRKLKGNYSELKDIDTRDVTDYLKNDLNNNKLLRANETINLPMYKVNGECK